MLFLSLPDISSLTRDYITAQSPMCVSLKRSLLPGFPFILNFCGTSVCIYRESLGMFGGLSLKSEVFLQVYVFKLGP